MLPTRSGGRLFQLQCGSLPAVTGLLLLLLLLLFTLLTVVPLALPASASTFATAAVVALFNAFVGPVFVAVVADFNCCKCVC